MSSTEGADVVALIREKMEAAIAHVREWSPDRHQRVSVACSDVLKMIG